MKTKKQFFILGPAVLKPRLQTLLEVAVGDDDIVSFCSEEKTMNWHTSAQVFQNILAKCGPLSTLAIKVYDYDFPFMGSLLRARCLTQSVVGHTLMSTQPKGPTKRKNRNLPFGLQLQNRRPKRQKTVPKSKTTGSQTTRDLGRKVLPETPILEMLQSSLDNCLDNDGDRMERCDSSESNQSQDCSTSDSSSSDSDCDTEGEELCADPLQRSEEKDVRQILASHEELQLVEQNDLNENRLTEPASSSNQTPAPKPARVPTQCNPNTGIVDVSLQLHGRLALCRECNQKIAKQSVRIGYSYNVKKFHSYIHATCFKRYLSKQQGDQRQACSFIEKWLESKKDCEASTRQQLEVLLSELG